MKAVDARHYQIEELTGKLTAILVFAGGHKKAAEVAVHHLEDVERNARYFEGKYFSRYGTYVKHVEEAVQLDDGKILICVTCGDWGGTFHSDTQSVKYFGLTPK